MSADELREEVQCEFGLLEKTIEQVKGELAVLGGKEPTAFQRAGFGALLMNLYSGIENILKRIAHFEEIEVPVGPRWHVELFNRFRKPLPGGRGPLFDEKIAGLLKDYRDFRHVMVHGLWSYFAMATDERCCS